MTTLAEAKLALYEQLAANTATGMPRSELVGVARIYMGEPLAGDMLGPIAITITTQAVTPTDFEFNVRVYAQMVTNALQAQAIMDDVVYRLEEFFTDSYPRNTWQYSYAENIDCLLADTTLQFPRDDF